MRIKGLPSSLIGKVRSRRPEKLPLATLFMAGFFVGILLVNGKRGELLSDSSLLSESSLYELRGLSVDGGIFLCDCVIQRLGAALIIAVLSTTYLGLVVCGGAAVWYGLCGGSLLTVSVLRYGIKGILLVVVGLLPQFFLYVPAFYFLLRWGEGLYRWIYVQKRLKSEAGENFLLPRKILQLFGILALLVAGCALESYVNPGILLGFLQIF